MSTNTAGVLVIMLHGVGSSGSDLAPLASALTTISPGVVFASPNAPYTSDFGRGYQWFSVAGITEDNRSARIGDARASFDKVISSIVEAEGFDQKLDRIAFLGFSQGTIMALDAVASGRWPVGVVVGFSGRLASPLPLQPVLETPILLVHGGSDAVIPASESSKAATALRFFGVSVREITLPGVPHTISPEGVAEASRFLCEVLEAPEMIEGLGGFSPDKLAKPYENL